MADTPEEVVVDVTPVDTTADSQNTVTEDEVELSPLEQKALHEGWKPKDQWEGDPDEWRDARSYLDRGELLKKISAANKEQKELRKAMSAMKEHNLKLAEARAKEEMLALRQEKIAALENQDAARVVELDDAIIAKKDDIAELSAKAKSQELEQAEGVAHPEFQAWIEDNEWYATNAGMRGYADAVGTEYARANPSIPPSKVLKYVADKVKEEFKIGKPVVKEQSRPSAVLDSNVRTGSTTTKKGASSALINSMSEQERQVMNTLVKGGHITEEKYLEDYRKIQSVTRERA